MHEGRKRLLDATADARPRKPVVISDHLGRLLHDAGLPAFS